MAKDRGWYSKLVVAGSRSITDYDIVHDTICESPWWPNMHGTIVVGGADKGVDVLAERFYNEAKHDFDLSIARFDPSDPDSLTEYSWDEHGLAAGPLRNTEMAQYGDALVAIWDGESNGTESMIESAKKAGIDLYMRQVHNESE